MKKTKRTLALLVLPVLVAFGCAEIDPIEAPAVSSGDADFSVYVSLGNSLTMGIQGLGLIENHQKRAHPALIARQMGKSVYSNSNEILTADSTAFVIPGWGAPGSPGLIRLVSLDPVTLEPLAPENAGSPVNTMYPIPYNNLAVSGFDVSDMLTNVGDEAGSLAQLVLRGQGTQVQQALALNPTFITLWAGANDVLAGATAGTPALMTSVEQFEEDYRLLIETLLGVSGTAGARPAQTAPTIVAGTIPSPTATPFMTTIDPFVDIPLVGRVPLLGPDGPLDPDDLVTLSAQSLLLMGFGFPLGMDLDGDGEPDGMGPLPGEVILSVSETETVLDRVSDLNDVIRTICGEYEIPVVEINKVFQEISAHGFEIGGINHTGEFLLGGLFSTDGVHPSDVGQAFVANEFIKVINDSFGASIPLVDLAEIVGLNFGVSPVKPTQPLDMNELDFGITSDEIQKFFNPLR